MTNLKFILIIFIFIIPLINNAQKWEDIFHFQNNDDFVITKVIGDENDNIFLTGSFLSTYDTYVSRGARDLYIAKISPTKNLIWFIPIGGKNIDLFPDITVYNDTLYFSGGLSDTIYIGISDTLIMSNNTRNVGLLKFSTNGNCLLKKEIAFGTSIINPRSIAIDNNNNLLITGNFVNVVNFEGTVFTQSGTHNFILKLDNNGNFIWAKNITGNNTSTRVISIKVYDDGYYFNGFFRDQINFDLGSLTSEQPSFSDIFLYKTDFNGNGLWVRRSRGTNHDISGSLTSDSYGNVYYSGYFRSPQLTFDSTAALQSQNPLINKGNNDIFIVKYNKTGVLQWTKGYGSSRPEYAVNIEEKNDFLYLSGYYTGELIFGQDTLTGNSIADTNMFLGTFDLQGNMLKGTHIKGSDSRQDISDALFVDNNNNVYVTGYFKSENLYVGESTLVNNNPGSFDGLVARYTPPYSAVFTMVNHPACHNDENGSLMVTPYFGVPPYQYTWSHTPDPGIRDSIASGLTAGSYSVTVKDSRDSIAVANITLIQPPLLAVSGVVANVSCFNGSNGAIDVTPSGGTPVSDTIPYTYTWTSPDGSGINPSAQDQNNISRGTYIFTLTDKNFCQRKDTFIVTQPDKITFGNSSVLPIIVLPESKGAVNLVVSGGTPDYIYNWNGPAGSGIVNNPSDSLENLSIGGTYMLQVADSKGCLADTAFLVPSDTMLNAAITSKTDVDCKGNSTGSATVSVLNGSGNYTYAWRDYLGNPAGLGLPTLSNVPKNTYIVRVTDNTDSRFTEVPVIISEPALELSVSSIIPQSLRCYNDNSGIVNLSVAGGTLPYAFNWNNGATTEDLVNVAASTYTVVVTDANGCQANAGTEVTQSSTPISLDIALDQSILCFGQLSAVATANGSGGTGQLSYLWNDPGAQVTKTATALGAGIYTVKATDINQCYITEQINITQPNDITTTVVYTEPLCYGSSTGQIVPSVVSGTGTPPFDYVWSTGWTERIISNIPAGTYTLTITDRNNCEKIIEYNLTQPLPVSIQSISTTDASCFGYKDGVISINASGGTGILRYSVLGGLSPQASNVFDTMPANSYTVKVLDANSCESPDSTVTINQPAGVDIISETPQNISCFGENNGSIVIIASGGAGSLEFSIDYGQSFFANNGSFSGLGAASYHVKIKDSDNCEFPGSTLVISEPAAISITQQVAENISCAGLGDGSITITASGGTDNLLYSVNNGADYLDNNGLFTGLSEGVYHVRIKDAINCDTAGIQITIVNPDTLVIDTTEVIHVTPDADGSVTLQSVGGTQPVTFIIIPVTSDIVPVIRDSITNNTGQFSNLISGYYRLYALDNNSCVSNTIDLVITGVVSTEIIIYDAFSPNNDAKNDFWNIGNIERYPNCKIKIFNSWGNLVFSSNGYPEPWDGTYNGKALPSGTYYYVIDLGDGSEILTGPVNIVK